MKRSVSRPSFLINKAMTRDHCIKVERMPGGGRTTGYYVTWEDEREGEKGKGQKGYI